MKKIRQCVRWMLLFVVLAATACGTKSEPEKEEVQEEEIVVEEDSDEPEEPDPAVKIQVSWDGQKFDGSELVNLKLILQGTMDDGTEVCLSEDSPQIFDANDQLVADYSKTVTEDGGEITISIYDTSAYFELSGEDGDYTPDAQNNEIIQANGVASVTDVNEKTYEYSSESGMCRAYTGFWFWGICNLDHGEICEYDSMVLNPGGEADDPREIGSDGNYISGLLGDRAEENDRMGYTRSIRIENGQIIVEGSFNITDDEYMDGRAPTAFGTYTFSISPDIEYIARGGDEPEVLTEEEFLSLAHCYNGLTLILRIKNNIVMQAVIAS